MTLRARLALGFLTIAILLFIPLAEALNALNDAKNATARLRDEAFAASFLVSRVRSTTNQLRRAEARVIAFQGDVASADDLKQQTRVLGALDDSLTHFGLADLAATVRRSAQVLNIYVPAEVAAVANRAGAEADRVSENHVLPAITAVEDGLASAERGVQEAARSRVDTAADAAASSSALSGALLAVAVLSAALVALWLTRSISRPVSDLERGMHAVANGRFAHKLEVAPGRRDEFGRLADSYRLMATQLAELDKLKAEFVSVASHELKTPINVIMGYLKLLEENLYGPLNPKQLDVVNIMQAQSAGLARLVQHLLDVSRFQAGAARLEVRPINLRAFLTQLDATYDVLALQRGVVFTVTSGPSLPDVVVWDEDRMHEVLGNLLSNAFKFTEANGHVDLTVAALDDAITMAVRDTGPGIAPSQLHHIFGKFFQADNQTASTAKGTGLGLAISKEIVEAHGGTIAVESTVGVGTTFTIVLPTVATDTSPRVDTRVEAGVPEATEIHA